uniref:Uncharacterized protein n=1 Tax=Arundo donax TaxID=35708 RepID=A0A0A9ENY7_ARUDO
MLQIGRDWERGSWIVMFYY